jgi:hypothetical protein
MSEQKTKNRLIKLINRMVEPYLWESGWVENGKKNPDGSYVHIKIWAPKKPKLFKHNELAQEVECLGLGWVSMDSYGGGMASTPMKDLPNCDLVAILEWLLGALPTRAKGARG